MPRTILVIVCSVLYLSGPIQTWCNYFCRHCDGSECITCYGNTCSNVSCHSTCDGYCNNTLDCLSCFDGFYLLTYENQDHDYCTSCRYQHCKCGSFNDCYECLKGYYGPLCQYDCPPNCRGLVCERNNGTCSSGSEQKCVIHLTTSEYKDTTSQDKTFSQGLGIGLGVAGVVAVGCMVLAIELLRKRKDAENYRQPAENTINDTPRMNSISSLVDAGINNSAEDVSIPSTSDYESLNFPTLNNHGTLESYDYGYLIVR